MLQRRCRRRRRAAQLEAGGAAAAAADHDDIESDSDHNDVDSQHSDAAVHLYMPVEQDSIDSAGDGTWQNVSLEPGADAEAAPYVQLHYVPPQQQQQSRHSHLRWQVFNDDSLDEDETDADEPPLLDFAHDSVAPVASAMSAASVEPSTSACAVHCLHLERLEPDAGSGRSNNLDFHQLAAVDTRKV